MRETPPKISYRIVTESRPLTGFVFDPVEFLGRLAVLVPLPRINLLLYYGVLGARAAWRAAVVPADPSRVGDTGHSLPSTSDAAVRDSSRAQPWAALMQRTFGFEPSVGRPDATGVRVRRAGVSAMPRPDAPHCPDSEPSGHRAHLAAP